MTLGKRHNLFYRPSSTGRPLAVVEYEIDCHPRVAVHLITPELLESLMGKFATDWENAKTIIAAKDKTISDQAAQIATLKGEVPDAADLAAEADVAAFVANAPPATAPDAGT